MTLITEVKKLISLMKKNGVTKLKTDKFEIEIDSAIYGIEANKELLKIEEPQKKNKEGQPNEDDFHLPMVRKEDLEGPFPHY